MLEGLKVIDLTWNVAGPLATKCLADYGAVVVKLESHKKVDLLRTYPPYGGGKAGVNRSTFGATYNSCKYSIGLDINDERGRPIIDKLIRWADVLVENFSPGAVARWGLDYESAQKINPQLIMVSASLQGQTGPSARQPGLGTMMESAAGFTHLLGWPDRGPSIGFAYMLTHGLTLLGKENTKKTMGKSTLSEPRKITDIVDKPAIKITQPSGIISKQSIRQIQSDK